MIELALLLAVDLESKEPAMEQREQQLQCVYVGGVGSNTQQIRQETGHTWEEFKEQTSKIYTNDEGYENLLKIAYLVYHDVMGIHKGLTPTQVFDILFGSCMAKFEPEEDKAQKYNL